MKCFIALLLLFSSFALAVTPFKCNRLDKIQLLVNQRVNIPFKCSQQINAIEITPKLPRGLEIAYDRIVGVLSERTEDTNYKVHITSAKTSDSYNDEFVLGSVSHLRDSHKGIKEEKSTSKDFILPSTYWYVYVNQTLDPSSLEWMQASFNPALDPYQWSYVPANNLPNNAGQKIVIYRTTFSNLNDIDNLKQLVGTIATNAPFGIVLNERRIYSRGVTLEDFGNSTKKAKNSVNIEDFELYIPIELIMYGENTLEIVLHSMEGHENEEKTFSFTMTSYTSTTEPVVQTIMNVGIEGMTIIADKTGRTASPYYPRLVDGKCGEQNKLSLAGIENKKDSIYPNKITCSFPQKAKFINRLQLGTVNNNNVFPKEFTIEGTMEMIGDKGVDSVWEEIFTHTAGSTGEYKSNKMYEWDMSNSNFHMYEGYRLSTSTNFNYFTGWGFYLEIGEFVVKYKAASNCKEEGFSSAIVGNYGTKLCPDDQYGYIKKKCTGDGFGEEINECKPKLITNLEYPNDGVALFDVHFNNSFVPTYEGLAKSFSIDCGEDHTEFTINKYGVIYNSPVYAYENLTCTVKYVGESGDEGEVVVTISSQNLYCQEGKFPQTIAGEYAEISKCSDVDEIYSIASGKYYCTLEYPPKFAEVNRCKYASPKITYPDSKFEFVKETTITDVEPISIELRHTNIYFSSDAPPGLKINGKTGVISGTTGTLTGTYHTVIRIENEDAFTTVNMEILVVNKMTTSIHYENMELYTGIAFKSPAPTLDSESILGTCSIEPELPEGLTLSCRTGVISGTNTDQIEGYEEQHTVNNTNGVKSNPFTIKINPVYCDEDDGFALTFPGSKATKPCSTLGVEGKEYGDLIRECKLTDELTASWGEPSDSGCHVAYPISFDIEEDKLTIVTTGSKNVIISLNPNDVTYTYSFDPPPPTGTFLTPMFFIFPKGSSYITTSTITVSGDHNITKTFDFKVYAPVCEEDGYSRTQVGETTTRKCILPLYGTIKATCIKQTPPPYIFTKDESACHAAYPTNVAWSIPEKLYVAFVVEPIKPTISNEPDSISFEWKDDKSPGGLRLDGKTGIISGTPTEDTQNSPEFTIVVHGDTDVDYKVNINVIQLKCEADDIYPEANAGETVEGKCKQGEVGAKYAKCIITQSGGNYHAVFEGFQDTCEEAKPDFTYSPAERGYKLGVDNINLLPEYDANIFPILIFSFEGLPTGLVGTSGDGSIKGIPKETSKDNINTISVSATTGNTAANVTVSLYISNDYRCVAKNAYPTSVKGATYDSPCVNGKKGNQRIECLTGGIWSDLITTNCSNPIIHSEENNLTVIYSFKAKGVTAADLLLEDIEGLKQGICAKLGLDVKSDKVQVVVTTSTETTVDFDAYIVTDKEVLTQARVEENLPNFQGTSTFQNAYKAVLGSKLTNSLLYNVINDIEAPKQKVTIPEEPIPEKEGLDDTTLYIIIGVAAAVGVLIILAICCLICYCHRVKSSHAPSSKAPAKKRGTKV